MIKQVLELHIPYLKKLLTALTGHWVFRWQNQALRRLPHYRCSADDGTCWSTSIWSAWQSGDFSSWTQKEFLQEGIASMPLRCCCIPFSLSSWSWELVILTLWCFFSFFMSRFRWKACLHNICMTILMLKLWLAQYQASKMPSIIWPGHTFSVAWWVRL